MVSWEEYYIELNEAEFATCEGRYFYNDEGFEIAAISAKKTGLPVKQVKAYCK